MDDNTALLAARYRLVALRREALRVQCNIDDFPEWGAQGGLDEPTYRALEVRQRGTTHAQRGAGYWALVERTPARAAGRIGDDDDIGDDDLVPGSSPLLLCHCESYTFDAVYRRPTATTGDELIRGVTHHIGSVFTLPAHRGKGLARFFLTAVARRLARSPRAVGSVLFSDIGPRFYDALGWRLHRSTMAVLKVPTDTVSASAGTAEDARPRETSPLFLDDDLDALLAADNARVLTEIAAMDERRGVFAVFPTRDAIEWQFCQGAHLADVRGFAHRPTACGAKVHEGAFVVWCHDLKESTLYITHARFPDNDAQTVVQLLHATIAEAQWFQLKVVKVWDPARALLDPTVRAQVALVMEDREESLSSLMLFDNRRDGAAIADEPPLWLNNAKFAWV